MKTKILLAFAAVVVAAGLAFSGCGGGQTLKLDPTAAGESELVPITGTISAGTSLEENFDLVKAMYKDATDWVTAEFVGDQFDMPDDAIALSCNIEFPTELGKNLAIPIVPYVYGYPDDCVDLPNPGDNAGACIIVQTVPSNDIVGDKNYKRCTARIEGVVPSDNDLVLAEALRFIVHWYADVQTNFYNPGRNALRMDGQVRNFSVHEVDVLAGAFRPLFDKIDGSNPFEMNIDQNNLIEEALTPNGFTYTYGFLGSPDYLGNTWSGSLQIDMNGRIPLGEIRIADAAGVSFSFARGPVTLSGRFCDDTAYGLCLKPEPGLAAITGADGQNLDGARSALITGIVMHFNAGVNLPLNASQAFAVNWQNGRPVGFGQDPVISEVWISDDAKTVAVILAGSAGDNVEIFEGQDLTFTVSAGDNINILFNGQAIPEQTFNFTAGNSISSYMFDDLLYKYNWNLLQNPPIEPTVTSLEEAQDFLAYSPPASSGYLVYSDAAKSDIADQVAIVADMEVILANGWQVQTNLADVEGFDDMTGADDLDAFGIYIHDDVGIGIVPAGSFYFVGVLAYDYGNGPEPVIASYFWDGSVGNITSGGYTPCDLNHCALGLPLQVRIGHVEGVDPNPDTMFAEYWDNVNAAWTNINFNEFNVNIPTVLDVMPMTGGQLRHTGIVAMSAANAADSSLRVDSIQVDKAVSELFFGNYAPLINVQGITQVYP